MHYNLEERGQHYSWKRPESLAKWGRGNKLLCCVIAVATVPTVHENLFGIPDLDIRAPKATRRRTVSDRNSLDVRFFPADVTTP